MFLLIAVLAILSAALFAGYLSRRSLRPVATPVLPEPPINARPLFEPTKRELRREQQAKEAREIARREVRDTAERRERIDAALAEWRAKHDAASAGDLLQAAVDHGREGDFARAAKEILDVYRESGSPRLTPHDLADLIDSHYRLLSQNDRASGALFWLKQEVAELRTRSQTSGSPTAAARKN